MKHNIDLPMQIIQRCYTLSKGVKTSVSLHTRKIDHKLVLKCRMQHYIELLMRKVIQQLRDIK